MPSGKIHALATTFTAGAGGAALMLFGGGSLAHGAAFVTGCLAGLIVNPDLDVRHFTYSHHIVRRSAGSIVAWLWSLVWWPYAHLIVPRHRHPLSHLPVVGTLIRVIYLWIVLALTWWGLGLLFSLPALAGLIPGEYWRWGLGALALVDALHALMDWLWPSPLRSPLRKIKVF